MREGTKDVRQGREKGTEEERKNSENACGDTIFSYAQLASNQFLSMLSQGVTNFRACSANE
jgi:hypothetical protein